MKRLEQAATGKSLLLQVRAKCNGSIDVHSTCKSIDSITRKHPVTPGLHLARDASPLD